MFLVLGLIAATVGGVVSGTSFSAEETECDGALVFEQCEHREASADGETVGMAALIPGGVMILAAIPMIATGHAARDREHEQRRQQPTQPPR